MQVGFWENMSVIYLTRSEDGSKKNTHRCEICQHQGWKAWKIFL